MHFGHFSMVSRAVRTALLEDWTFLCGVHERVREVEASWDARGYFKSRTIALELGYGFGTPLTHAAWDVLAPIARCGSFDHLQILVLRCCSGGGTEDVPSGFGNFARGLLGTRLPSLWLLRVVDAIFEPGDVAAAASLFMSGAMSNLKKLEMILVPLGDAELASLAPALARLPALETLELEGNGFGDEGLHALTCAGFDGGFASLVSLDFVGNAITTRGCRRFMSALATRSLFPALREVDVSHNNDVDDTTVLELEFLWRLRR